MGLTHTGTRRDMEWTTGHEGERAAKTVKRPPQHPAQPPVRQLLGPANAATTQGTPAAAAVRTQRPDAARGGENG